MASALLRSACVQLDVQYQPREEAAARREDAPKHERVGKGSLVDRLSPSDLDEVQPAQDAETPTAYAAKAPSSKKFLGRPYVPMAGRRSYRIKKNIMRYERDATGTAWTPLAPVLVEGTEIEINIASPHTATVTQTAEGPQRAEEVECVLSRVLPSRIAKKPARPKREDAKNKRDYERQLEVWRARIKKYKREIKQPAGMKRAGVGWIPARVLPGGTRVACQADALLRKKEFRLKRLTGGQRAKLADQPTHTFKGFNADNMTRLREKAEELSLAKFKISKNKKKPVAKRKRVAESIQNRSKYNHYLGNKQNDSFTLSGNLPGKGRPAISNDVTTDKNPQAVIEAVDAATPKTPVWVVSKTPRPVYPLHRKGSAGTRDWAFVVLGKQQHGQWVADESRRGYVPMDVLEAFQSAPRT